MDSAKSENGMHTVLLSHLALHERLSQTGRTKTDRVFACAAYNALLDALEDAGLPTSTAAFYRDLERTIQEAG